MLTEEQKLKRERQLEALDATLSAIKVAFKWLKEQYPDFGAEMTKAEVETIKQTFQHLDKSQLSLQNFIQLLFPLEE